MARVAGLTLSLNNYSAFRQHLKVLDDVIAGLDKSIDTAGKSFDKLEDKLGLTEPSAAKLGKTFKDTTNVIKTGTNDIDNGVSRLMRTAQTLESIGTKVALGISAPAGALKAFAASSAIAFESSFAGVVKTLDTTNLSAEETTTVLAELRQGIRDLATDVDSPLAGLGNAHNELARIAELGSQLGVAKEGILEFTETIGLLAMTSDMTADAGATNIAQFANIMQSTDFDRIGSTIVELGNKSAATESQIIEFGQRLAGAFAQVGASEADVLGFGAAMASVGLNAEAGGTAMTRVVNGMIEATALGGESLATFADVAGISVDEFKQLFEEDAAGAISTFVTGLSELESSEMLSVFETLGFSDVRVSDTLRRLSSAPHLLAESLDVASQAFEENTAMQEEAQKRFETTAAQINLLKNNITDLAISLGDAMLPGINRGIDTMVTFIQAFQDASPAAFRFTAAILGVAAAAGPVILFAAQLVKAFEILSITISLPAWYVIAAAIAAVGVVLYDLQNNIGGAADELAAIGTNFAALFSIISEIGTGIVGVFQFIIGLMPLAERSFSPVAAALGFINDQITNLTSGLSKVRDFLTLFNAAQGNFPVTPSTEADEERNRLLEERYRLLDDITRLEEEGLETQTAALTVQVESGDTLWDIARANNTTVEELMRLNNLDTNILQIGQELMVAAGSTQSTADEMQRLSQELAAVDEQLRALPTGVQAGFDAFAETPLFDRIFGTDEGARDRALDALTQISLESLQIKNAVAGVVSGFAALFAGDFDAGIESIRSGFSSIADSVRDMFNIFQDAGPQPFMLAGDEGMFADMGAESGGNMFAGLGESIKSGLEEIANGDYSSVETLLGDNLGAVLTGAVSILANIVLPGSGIFVGLAAKMVGAMEMDFADIETLFGQSTILQSIQDGVASLFSGGDSFMLAGEEEMFGMTGGSASADGWFAPITEGLQTFIDTIQPIISAIELVWESSLRPAIDTLMVGIGGFAEQFNQSLDQDALEEGTSILQTFIDFLVVDLATNIKFFGSIIGAIASGIGTALPDLGGALAELINIVTDVLSGDFESAAGSIAGFVTKLASAIGNFVIGTADSIIGFLEDLTGMDFASAGDVIQSIQNLADMTIGEGIRTLHEFITNLATGNFENTALGQFLAGLPDMFGNAFRSIGREIGILIDTFILKWQMVQSLLPGGGEGDATALRETEQRIQSARVMQGAFGALGPDGLNLSVPISFEIEGRTFNNTLAEWLNTPGILNAASEDSRLFIEQALNSAAQSADFSSFNTVLTAAIASGFDISNLNVALTPEMLAGLAGTTTPEQLADMILGFEAGGGGTAIFDALNQAITDAALAGDTDLATTLFSSLAGTFNEDAIAALGTELEAAGGADFATNFVNNTMIPSMETAFGEMDASTIGLSIIEGFTTGITDNQAAATDAMTTFTEDLQAPLIEGFGVQSPSLWMQDFALSLIEGLQIGLINNLPLLEIAFMLLQEQFAPIVTTLNSMFDTVIMREQTMIDMMRIAGQVWGLELKGMDKGINKIGNSISSLVPKIEHFISLMGKIPAIAIINLQGTSPGTPPPNQAVATVEGGRAAGGPGMAGAIYRVSEPEIGGIEIIRQDGGGTYIVSGRDFMAVPPTSMPMAAPVGSLPMPPAAMGGSNFGGSGSSIIFEQPVVIENPSGGPVTPDTIAAGMQQWQRQNPPRRQLRDSL